MRQIKHHHNRGEFRIESNCTLRNPHWAMVTGKEMLVRDRSLAVALAVKTLTVPCGGEIRVVHAPTGEIIFRKGDDCGCHT